ncbi:MAG: mechanosensitive ion channel family protein [Clostridia bacterium]|jgi:MscS family membrane protein|nr:mechanosensitive ion channel family protein [Clostridia bacterium]MBP6161894.1 mechanosensitive ion channel family protein [Clostridia bacterium]
MLDLAPLAIFLNRLASVPMIRTVLEAVDVLTTKKEEVIEAFDRWAIENWLISAILLGTAIVLFMLRRPIAKGVLYVLLARTRRRDPEAYKAMREEMYKPLGCLFPAFFLSISASLATFIPEPWDKVTVRVFDTIVTVAAFWLLYKTAMYVGIIVMRRPTKTGLPIGDTGAKFLVSMTRVAIIVIGVFVVLSLWVKNITGLVTGLGIGGLAISLASQDLLANFLGSLAVLLDEPFKVGDWIITTHGEGTVEKVGMRSSKLRMFDGGQMTIPNKELASCAIINSSNRERRRAEMKLTLPWEMSSEQCDEFRERLAELLDSIEPITSVQFIEIDNLTPEGMELYIRYFTGEDFDESWKTRTEVNRGMMKIADEMNLHLYIPGHIILIGDETND